MCQCWSLKKTNAGYNKIIVNEGGIFNVQGDTLTYRKTTLASSVVATDDTLETTDATEWKVGDNITIEPTGTSYTELEVSTITAINGTSITISPGFSFNHSTGTEIVNLSRNCKIINKDTINNSPAILNISTTTASNFNMEWVEISGLGQTSQIHAIEFGSLSQGDAKGTVTNCSIHGCEYGIYLNNSDNNTISNNVFCNIDKQAIYLKSSIGNTFSNNVCMGATNGIYLELSSSSNTFTSNSVYGNSSYGIYLNVASCNVLKKALLLFVWVNYDVFSSGNMHVSTLSFKYS